METFKPPEAIAELERSYFVILSPCLFGKGFLLKHMSKGEQKILVFLAALWATIEVSLGTILSLSKVPFRGFFLAMISCFFLIVARNIINKPRSSVYLASIVAIVKLIFSIGAGGFNSAVAIFLEGVIAEIVLSLIGFNIFSSAIAGGGIVLYPFCHSLLTQTIIFGVDIFKIYNKILSEFQILVGKSANFTIVEIIAFFAFVYFLFGLMVGAFSFVFSKKIIFPILTSKNSDEFGKS